LPKLFAALEAPKPDAADGMSLSACPIPGVHGHRVAKDVQGEPLVLVSTAGAHERLPAPVRLENIAIDHGVHCKIWQGEKLVEEGIFTVLKCLSRDASLRDHFLSVGGPFLLCLGDRPSPSQVAAFLDTLVQLFRALTEPPRKSVQGMWAELFLIASARDARAMMRAWHPTPDERYDFSAGSQRLEVKSAVGRPRRHHFSLEQLAPPLMTTVLIASVCTERAGGGASLGDLIAQLRSRLTRDADLLLRLDAVVAATLGRSLLQALDEAYDLELAKESLSFFEVAAVPRPPGAMPREVSNVRFVADLSNVEPVELALYTGAEGLFEAALPQ